LVGLSTLKSQKNQKKNYQRKNFFEQEMARIGQLKKLTDIENELKENELISSYWCQIGFFNQNPLEWFD
jgi:hypothetical protein